MNKILLSAVVYSLFIVAPIVCVGYLFCCEFFCVLSSFVIISLAKRELIALLL